MFELILENQRGDAVALNNTKNYDVKEIDGLYPAGANIVTSQTSLDDGSKYNSSKVNERSLNISVAIKCDAERSRLNLYKIIKPKHYIKMIYRSAARDVFCEGYVSDISIDHFAQQQSASISIICPEPYFNDAQEIIDTITQILDAFHFPFAITSADPVPLGEYNTTSEMNIINSGEVESGAEIEIHATGTVKNPAIYNRETGEYFKLETTLQDGDTVHINTKIKKKSVYVFRDGQNVNLFNYVSEDSTWLQLMPGDNVLTYDAEDDTASYMEIRIIHRNMYVGV